MNLERLREIRDELEPYSYGIGGIQVKFPFGTDDLCLTAFPSTKEKFEKTEEILKKYEKDFLRIDIYRSPNQDLDEQFLKRIDFLRLADLMSEVIGAELQAILDDPPSDAIYAFVVGISPAHYSIDISANTDSEWQSRKDYYEREWDGIDDSSKYWSPEFTLKQARAFDDVWEPLEEILGDIDDVIGEHHDLTNGSELFYSTYERRFYSDAVHALRRNWHLVESISHTDDFVAYVQDYTGSGDPLYTTLETVPLRRVKEMYPYCFAPENGKQI